MAEDRLTIDTATMFDNADEHRVEFAAEVSGERYEFAVLYDVLESLAAEVPVTQPVAIVQRHLARIERLGVVALARDPDQERVVISENDLV